MAGDGYGLGRVTEAELAAFGDWLVRSRGLTPRPVGDYKSRVRRLARGVDMSTLTVDAQATLETAARAFLEFRNDNPPRSVTYEASTPTGNRPKVQYGVRAILDLLDDRAVLREASHWLSAGRPSRAVRALDRGRTTRAAEVRQEIIDASGGLERCESCGEPNDDLLLAQRAPELEGVDPIGEWVICDDCAAHTGSTIVTDSE